jgi:hypothetical protein
MFDDFLTNNSSEKGSDRWYLGLSKSDHISKNLFINRINFADIRFIRNICIKLFSNLNELLDILLIMRQDEPVINWTKLVDCLKSNMQLFCPSKVKHIWVNHLLILWLGIDSSRELETIEQGPKFNMRLDLDLFNDSFSSIRIEETCILLNSKWKRTENSNRVGLWINLSHTLYFPKLNIISILKQMLLVFMDGDNTTLWVLSDISDDTLSVLLSIFIKIVVIISKVSEDVSINSHAAS